VIFALTSRPTYITEAPRIAVTASCDESYVGPLWHT
jgi:hypothetical protein